MRRALSLLAGVLLGCAPMAAPVSAAAKAEAVTLSLSSWGIEFVRWRITPDGAIRLAQAPPDWMPSRPPQMSERRTGPSAARFRWVSEHLAALRAVAGTELPCTQEVTDMPYGTMVWGDGVGATGLSFYSACSEKRTRTLTATVQEVTAQVIAWVDQDQPRPAK